MRVSYNKKTRALAEQQKKGVFTVAFENTEVRTILQGPLSARGYKYLERAAQHVMEQWAYARMAFVMAYRNGRDMGRQLAKLPAPVAMPPTYRSSTQLICPTCDLSYGDHVRVPNITGALGGGAYLNKLCNGDEVKL